MEVKINREIRNYTEAVFFGLSLRQIIFSACALAVAVAVFFLLKPSLGKSATFLPEIELKVNTKRTPLEDLNGGILVELL